MAHAAPTKQGQAQSRGVAVEGLGFARLPALLALALAAALARSLLLARCLCFGWWCREAQQLHVRTAWIERRW